MKGETTMTTTNMVLVTGNTYPGGRVTVYTPVEIANRPHRNEELELELPDGIAMLYFTVEATGLDSYDFAVAAEVWRDGVDDDGDGEPVTDVAGIAALVGCCEATGEAVARYLDETLADILLSRWESHHDC
jgi:hypothetical protein